MFNFRSVLVFGCGITGLSVCNFLLKQGLKIYLTDDNPQNLEKCKTNQITLIKNTDAFDFNLVDFFVVSPGIRLLNNPHIIKQLSENNNKEIWTDLDILQEFYPTAKYIGITGTNGKSTTVSMLDHILKTNKIDVFTCGNIGIPILDIDRRYDYILLELSSYQLENARKLNIDLSVIINISPSHLDHHGGFDEYLEAKARICSSTYLINGDSKILSESIDKSEFFSTKDILLKGISVTDNGIYFNSEKIAKIEDFINSELPFKYHPQNLACVFWLAMKIGIKINEIVDSLKTYKPLAHRTEPVRKIGRITFINDSKATNIPAAIKGISENKNIILIMGGKMLTNYDNLSNFLELKNNIKKIFLIGESAEFLQAKLNENNIENEISSEIKSAVKNAYKKAIQLTKNNKYDNFLVMLCPMHPSTDQFINFEERGDIFKALIDSL